MATYKIVGPLNIAGHEPGEVISDDDLIGASVDHLIEAGHIAETKATEADTTNNQED